MIETILYRIKLFFSGIWFGKTYRKHKLKTRHPEMYRWLCEEDENARTGNHSDTP